MKRSTVFAPCAAILVLAGGALLRAADCNGNGIDDAVDIAPRDFGFEDPLGLETRGVASAVLVVDLDGDSDNDLAAAEALSRNEPGSVTVFRNQPAGWGPAEEHAAGSYLTALAAADLDADGDFDLAAGSFFAEALSVLSNRGAGDFGEEVGSQAGGQPLSLTPADLDGDGDADLAAGLTSGLGLHFNDGTGRLFKSEVLLRGMSVAAVRAGDFDRDGDLDFGAAAAPQLSSGSGSVVLLLNAGEGEFTLGPQASLEGSGAGLAAGDLDGDADIDLVAAVPLAGHIAVLFNDGAGGFLAPMTHQGGAPETLAALDMDGDGDPDAAAADLRLTRSGPSTATVFLNDGSGGFPRPHTVEFESPYVPAFLDAGDLDGDGIPDLAVSGNGSVALFVNHTVSPASLDQNHDGIPDECQSSAFIRGDANADGEGDIADPIFTLLHVFAGQRAPPCATSADADDNGRLEVTDAVYSLRFLFLGGPAPPLPFPGCGRDPTAGGLLCSAYPPCP